MKRYFIFSLFFISLLYGRTKVFLDTDYKVTHIEYSDIDFDSKLKTSTDTFNHTYSWLRLSLRTFINEIEFCSTLSSLGTWGKKENNIIPAFLWQKNLPYPDTKFSPWVEEAYLRYNYSIVDVPLINNIFLTATLGRQKIEFLKGLIVGDNGIGYDSIHLKANFDKYIYLQTFMSKFLTDLYTKNFVFSGIMLGSKFFSEYDFGITSVVENNEFENDKKIFYEFFLQRELDKWYYFIEYATQEGSKENKKYSGNLWYFKGGVLGENKLLGKVTADAVWLLSSGGSKENIFSPTFSKQFYGLEPYGYGEFAAGNVHGIFFDLPAGYSGMFVLGLELSSSPLKNFFFKFNYYLYSSPEAPGDKPDPSATEKVLGAKKAIGVEYGIVSKYQLGNYINLTFSYSIFDPTTNAYPKTDPATKIKLSTEIKL